MRTIRLATCLGVVALLGLTAACSDDETTSDSTTTTAAVATTANRGFEVNTPDGQVSLSLSGELPPNWPADFPLPSGAEPAGSGSLGGSSGTGFVGVFSTSGSPEETYDYYRDDAGLTVTNSSSLGSGNAYVGNIEFSGNPSGSVTVIPYSGETLIIVILSESSSGTTTVAGSGTTVAP